MRAWLREACLTVVIHFCKFLIYVIFNKNLSLKRKSLEFIHKIDLISSLIIFNTNCAIHFKSMLKSRHATTWWICVKLNVLNSFLRLYYFYHCWIKTWITEIHTHHTHTQIGLFILLFQKRIEVEAFRMIWKILTWINKWKINTFLVHDVIWMDFFYSWFSNVVCC